MSLDASRLGRIRLSTHQLSSLEQLQASQREKAAAAAGGGAAEGSESSSGGSGGGGAGAATPPATAAAADAPSSTEVSIGSDVAFAMDEGTGSSRQIKFWIGRVVKLFKGRATWRRPVPVDGDLPTDIFASVRVVFRSEAIRRASVSIPPSPRPSQILLRQLYWSRSNRLR